MLELNDTRWKDLHGGYRVAYDASVPLQALTVGDDVWNELWEELHHQGDVDVASYAAVTKLIDLAPQLTERDWNFYGLIAVIEVERHRRDNPAIPEWLVPDYESAWQSIIWLASNDLLIASDGETVQAILSVLALAKGSLKLGALIIGLDRSELDELLEERCDWAQTYRE
jgi:hypothetical protein